MAGPALNASLIDMGNRFRLLVNTVDAVLPTYDLPNLPVARVLWQPQPNLDIAATAWILAGGAHHTVFTQALNVEYLEDFVDIADIELIVIDEDTKIRTLKDQINHNEAFYLSKIFS
jgi:L-arabinose isomerase